MNKRNNTFIGKILAIIVLWQVIAFLIAIIPLLIKMQNMTGDPEEMVFLAEWLKSWLTGMVQLLALILSIVFNDLYVIKYGSSQSSGLY